MQWSGRQTRILKKHSLAEGSKDFLLRHVQ